jgi:hypothetical protein
MKEGTTPAKKNIRKKAVVEKEIIDREVKKMLELGVI